MIEAPSRPFGEALRSTSHFRALYAWYIAFYAGWILVQTFAWFAVSYLPQQPAWLPPAVNFLWVAASVGMMLVVPHYVAIVGGFTLSRTVAALLCLPAAALLTALVLLLRHPAPAGFEAISLAFNGAIGALVAVGAVRVGRRKSTVPRHEVLPFLVLSVLLYALLLSLNVLLAVRPLDRTSMAIANVAAGAFCLPWGVLLVAGAANREIGGKLFISPRTVEAHIYSVYRKCDCRNRVELVNRIRQYPPTP